jgi:multicomponent Na+:H+ antiporter subunit D
VEVAWFRQAGPEQPEIREAPVLMLAVTWVAALGNIYFGLDPSLQIKLAADGARMLLGGLP